MHPAINGCFTPVVQISPAVVLFLIVGDTPRVFPFPAQWVSTCFAGRVSPCVGDTPKNPVKEINPEINPILKLQG